MSSCGMMPEYRLVNDGTRNLSALRDTQAFHTAELQLNCAMDRSTNCGLSC